MGINYAEDRFKDASLLPQSHQVLLGSSVCNGKRQLSGSSAPVLRADEAGLGFGILSPTASTFIV